MIFYNITCNVAPEALTLWLDWIQKNYLPDLINSSEVEAAVLMKVESEAETSGLTFAVQYKFKDPESLTRFKTNEAIDFKNTLKSIFGDNVLHFSTKLLVVNEFR